ncbi:NEW3 domain-containing protein [Salinibaculum salinum]|uniref:COG1361 S-layer family protein n=1 Tax=Salinibaculum salinum TaxID=3131996 RepID=UPI0030EE5FCD
MSSSIETPGAEFGIGRTGVQPQTAEAQITDTTAESGTYTPGEIVSVDVTVENTGDTTHDFYVDASLQRPNGNWVTGEGTTLYLSPGEQQSVTLAVEIPTDAPEGTYSAGSGVFYSSTKEEQFDYGQDLDSFEVTEPTTDARISHTDAPSGTYAPGESAPVDIAVENTGDTTHEFYVDASIQLPNGDWVTGEATTPYLSPGEEQSSTLYVQIPTDASEGTYGAGAAVFDSSEKNEKYGSGDDLDSFEVSEPTTDARITQTTASSGTYTPGETVPIDVTVENTGDTTHEFYADASIQLPNGDWVTGEATTPSLEPGEDKTVTLAVQIPSDASEGIYSAGSAVFDSDEKNNKYGSGDDLDSFEVSEPTTNAQITQVTASGGTYTPGESVPVDVAVENTGDTTHDFYTDASIQLPDGDWVTGEATSLSLSPGEDRTVTLGVQIPSDAPEGVYGAGAAVFHSSDQADQYGSGNDLDSFEVSEPTTDARISYTDVSSGTYAPGDSVPVDLVVENTGDTTHEFYVDASIELPNDDWVTGDATTVYLSPGEEQSVTLDVEVPTDAPDGTYSAGAAVFHSSEKNDKYGSGDDLDSFEVSEPTTDARITQTTASSGTYTPGETVPIEVVIENTGDTTHEFYADASIQLPNGDWVTGEATTPSLEPGEDETVTLDVQIPTDASEGTYSAGAALFHSSKKTDQYGSGNDLDAFEVTEPTTDAQISYTDASEGTYTPGETVPVELAVENTGETTHDFYVDASIELPNGDWVTGEDITLSLSPGEERTMTLGVQIPTDAPDGTYSAGAAVFHGGDKTDQYGSGNDIDSFEVAEPTTDAQISDTNAVGGTYAPGKSVPVDITVENTGDTTHEFYADASVQLPNGDWVTGETTTLSLEPGEDQTTTLDVQLPTDAPEGVYSAGAAIFQSSEKAEQYDSGGDLDSFEVVKSTTDARITQTSADSGTYAPGDTVPVGATVENTGDITHEFYTDASVQLQNGDWVTGEATTVSLTPDEERTITLAVEIPTDAAGGTYSVGTGIFKSEEKTERYDSETGADSITVETSSQPATPVLSREKTQPEVTVQPGESLSFRVAASTDERTLRHVRWAVDNETREVHEVSESAGQDTWTRRFNTPGTYRVSAIGLNSVQNASEPQVWTVTVEESATDTVQIEQINTQSAEIGPDEGVEPSVTVTNTGTSPQTVRVGLTIQGPDGRSYATLEEYERSISIEPNSDSTTDFAVPLKNGVSGSYDVTATVWRDQPLDEQEQPLGQKTVVDSFHVSEQTDSPSRLTVRVETFAGEAVDGATVSPLLGEDYTTGSDGTVTIAPSESSVLCFDCEGSGKISLEYSYDSQTYDVQGVKDVRVTDEQTQSVTITLPRQTQVRGRVVAGGEPLDDVSVVIGNQKPVLTGENGYFQATTTPASTYTRVLKNNEVLLRQVVSYERGSEQLELTVPEDRYQAASGADEYVTGIVEDLTDDDASQVYGEMYGDVEESNLVTSGVTLGESDQFYVQDGSYYTSGPCASYRSGDLCERGATVEKSGDVYMQGMTDGVYYGGKETVNGFRDLFTPQYYYQMISLAKEITKDPALVTEMVASMPAQIRSEQRSQNPYPTGTDQNATYAESWYAGYGGFLLVTTVASGGAASFGSKAVSTSSKFNKLLDQAKNLPDSDKTRAVSRAADTVTVNKLLGNRVELPDPTNRLSDADKSRLLKQDRIESLDDVASSVSIGSTKWDTLKGKHIPKYMSQRDIPKDRTAFPTGDRVNGVDVPEKMTEAEVLQTVQKSLREPDTVEFDGSLIFERDVDVDGVDRVRVVVDPADGEVISTYPTSGSAVKTIPADE